MSTAGDAFLFMGQMVRRWRHTGALLPSGPALTRAMARAVGELAPGTSIIELGPGTGVFTRELMRCHHGHPVVAVEFNPAFAARLRRDLPGARIIEGCASRLPEHLAGIGIGPQQVGVVVSGLPLISLPGSLPGEVLAALTSILLPGRRYVQFTYARSVFDRLPKPGLRRESAERIWLNMPPAHVMRFVRE